MKTIIVDDRNSIREFITQLLDTVDDINIVGEANNVESAIQKINSLKPQLILLDIQMPDGNGFDVLEGLTHKDYKVIFITSYEEFAIKAFKYSALDYVIKPIEPEAFYGAINRAKDVFNDNNQELKIESLIKNLRTDSISKKIVLNTQETVHVVDTKDIIRCESDGSYTVIYLANGSKILMSKKIKDFEEMLEKLPFYRVHRSHLINLHFVDRFEKRDGGYIVMKNKDIVPLSQVKKDEFFILLQGLSNNVI